MASKQRPNSVTLTREQVWPVRADHIPRSKCRWTMASALRLYKRKSLPRCAQCDYRLDLALSTLLPDFILRTGLSGRVTSFVRLFLSTSQQGGCAFSSTVESLKQQGVVRWARNSPASRHKNRRVPLTLSDSAFEGHAFVLLHLKVVGTSKDTSAVAKPTSTPDAETVCGAVVFMTTNLPSPGGTAAKVTGEIVSCPALEEVWQ